jgi:thimet oligopeptidase
MPGMLHDYTHVTADDVTTATDAAIAEAGALIDTAAASADAPSFDATLRPIELAGARMVAGYGRAAFMGYVHVESAVRDAGNQAEQRLAKWAVSLPFREDLYRAVSAFAATDEAAALSGERRRLLEFWMRDFHRAGQGLGAEPRAELEQLRNRLVELESDFQREINEYRDGIDATDAQLDGLPADYVARLAPGTTPGTRRVTLDGPDLEPFLSHARDRGARETLMRKSWNRCVAANRARLEEAARLRRRIAELLGHPTWAHHAMEVKMAGTPERVRAFYDEIVPPLEAAARREVAEMEALAAADGVTGPIQAWDWQYYEDRISKERYEVDQTLVSQYLPLDPVVDGMFALTGEVFGLEYRRVEPVNAWHPSVQLFEIRDRASGELLAHFYADLHPREGKYNHAAAFPIVIAHRDANGQRVTPVSAIVANFTPPSADRPSLLRHGPHGEIETLFHEFGHILHMSLSQAEFARFSGAETERDFVEAPSQIMEHWVWEPEVLARFARHYATGEPIPADLLAKMRAARYLDVGIRGTRQVFFGLIDLGMHAVAGAPDLDQVTREGYAVTQIPYPEGTFMLSGFGHLMGGYDAGYYGYLWAEVIGDDMWGRFAAEGITSPAVGAAYRRAILEPNGARAGDDMVADFLGRPASVQTYLKMRDLA